MVSLVQSGINSQRWRLRQERGTVVSKKKSGQRCLVLEPPAACLDGDDNEFMHWQVDIPLHILFISLPFLWHDFLIVFYVCDLQGYVPPAQYVGAGYVQQPHVMGQQYAGQPTTITVQPTMLVTRTPLAQPFNDYLGYSIFTMLCCCLPLGIAALVYSIFVSLIHSEILSSLWIRHVQKVIYEEMCSTLKFQWLWIINSGNSIISCY